MCLGGSQIISIRDSCKALLHNCSIYKMKVAAAKTIERIEREFHRRAFGDERARVNALPAAERGAYLARLRRRAVSGAGGISAR